MKVVLAYSGGLDTSVIGQGGDEIEATRRAARETGASDVFVEDLRDVFVRECVFPAQRANAIYEGYYLMGTAPPARVTIRSVSSSPRMRSIRRSRSSRRGASGPSAVART